MGKIKIKKEEPELDESHLEESFDAEKAYKEKLGHVSAIAHPMASRKLTGKIYKLIKKASKHKTYMRNGIKAVQTRIRKGERGLVILAGNVSPIEVMCHLPAVCEDLEIPYVYTPSREDIGAAMGVKRGCLTVLIREHEEYESLYNKVLDGINKVPRVF